MIHKWTFDLEKSSFSCCFLVSNSSQKLFPKVFPTKNLWLPSNALFKLLIQGMNWILSGKRFWMHWKLWISLHLHVARNARNATANARPSTEIDAKKVTKPPPSSLKLLTRHDIDLGYVGKRRLARFHVNWNQIQQIKRKKLHSVKVFLSLFKWKKTKLNQSYWKYFRADIKMGCFNIA